MGKSEIIAVSVLSLIEYVSFCYVFLKKKRAGASVEKSMGLAGAAVLYFVLLMRGYSFNPVMFLAVNLVCIFLFQFLYGSSLRESVGMWFLAFAFLGLTETFFRVVFEAWMPWNGQFINIVRISLVVICLMWLYYFFIGRKTAGEKRPISKILFFLIVGLLLVYELLMVFVVNLLKSLQSSKQVMLGSALVMLAGMGVFGMIIAILYYFQRTEKYRFQSEIAEMYNEQQKEYFLKLLEREQETRKLRHDIFSHFMVIQRLCKEEDVEIKTYISHLLNDGQEVSCRQLDVGNDIVNAIINYYFVPVWDKCNIGVKGYIGDLETISGTDLCVLVSNLVKNAVEAALNVQAGKGEIRFLIREGNQYLNIYVKNTFEGDIVFDKKGLPKTSKNEKGSHGFGVRNIKQVAEKYDGKCSIKAEGNWYIADIFLNKMLYESDSP